MQTAEILLEVTYHVSVVQLLPCLVHLTSPVDFNSCLQKTSLT